MKKWLFTVLFGLALVLGACGGGGDEGASDDSSGDSSGDSGTKTEESSEGDSGKTVDTAAAEKIFQNNCASCHGADLSGAVGPNLQEVGSRLSADEISNIIKNGRGNMPPQKQVSKEDRQTLASWLASKK